MKAQRVGIERQRHVVRAGELARPGEQRGSGHQVARALQHQIDQGRMQVRARRQRGGGGHQAHVARRQVGGQIDRAFRQHQPAQVRHAPGIGIGPPVAHRRQARVFQQGRHRGRAHATDQEGGVQAAVLQGRADVGSGDGRPVAVGFGHAVQGQHPGGHRAGAAARRPHGDAPAEQFGEVAWGLAAPGEQPDRLEIDTGQRLQLPVRQIHVRLHAAQRQFRTGLDEADHGFRLAGDQPFQIVHRAVGGDDLHLQAAFLQPRFELARGLMVTAGLRAGQHHQTPGRGGLDEQQRQPESGDDQHGGRPVELQPFDQPHLAQRLQRIGLAIDLVRAGLPAGPLRRWVLNHTASLATPRRF